MKAMQLEKLGIPATLAKWMAAEARRDGTKPHEIRQKLADLVEDPNRHRDDPHFG